MECPSRAPGQHPLEAPLQKRKEQCLLLAHSLVHGRTCINPPISRVSALAVVAEEDCKMTTSST